MKTLCIVWLCLIACGCDYPLDERQVTTNYAVVVIDGCEYIVPRVNTHSMVHKANCTNAIHAHNQ